MTLKQSFKIGVRTILCVLAFMLSIFYITFSISCEKPAAVPTTSPSPVPSSKPEQPSKPVKTGWLADGVITSGEYTKTTTYGNYEINWGSDDKYIHIGMKAKTGGWIAVGFQPGARMKNADMMFGFVKEGKTIVYDLFSTGDFGPHRQDIELGGSNDILEFGGKEEGGYTVIEFKRLFDTGDKYDVPLSKGVNKIIWAHGSDDQLAPKHIERGYGEIEF